MKKSNYPRILILSDATWADDNNIGNTFSNIFEDWPKEKIAMIYARPDMPNTVICDNFFQISEKRLLKGILKSNVKAGQKINYNELRDPKKRKTLTDEESSGKKIYSFFLKYRWNFFLLARELLWKISDWKTKELDRFIDEFNPDVVLSLACSSIYMNKIQQYVINYSKAKSVIYFVDDVYSLKRYSLSPLFWFNKLLIRKSIKRTVELSSLIYTIVQKQKTEYDKSFNSDSKTLNKGGHFNKPINMKPELNKVKKLIYTGNIYAGRWETLKKIGESLDEINKQENKGILHIYSKNKLSSKMKKNLSKIDSIEFKGGIPASEVEQVQSNADILLHVESLRLKEKLLTRLSFSTKLVDYFTVGKCILAVGWKESASIEYLKKNELAVVVDDLTQIKQKLKKLLNEPETIDKYGQKSWEFGRENHNISDIRNSVKNDMLKLTHANKSNR